MELLILIVIIFCLIYVLQKFVKSDAELGKLKNRNFVDFAEIA